MRLCLVCGCLLTLSLWSCLKENDIQNDFNQISKREQQLLDDCSAHQLVDSLEIAQNIPGNWQLVGYGCGFCVPSGGIFISLSLERDSTGFATYQDNTFAETINFTWNLDREIIEGDTLYNLATQPARAYLYMSSFCEEYMFRNEFVNDGVMFLFKKQ